MKLLSNKLLLIFVISATLFACEEEKVVPQIEIEEEIEEEEEEPQKSLFNTQTFSLSFNKIMRGCFGGNYVLTSEMDSNKLLTTSASVPHLGKFGENIISFEHITDEYDSVLSTNVTFNETGYSLALTYEFNDLSHKISFINSSTDIIQTSKYRYSHDPFNRILYETHGGKFSLTFYNERGQAVALSIDRFEEDYPIPYDGYVSHNGQNNVSVVEIPGEYGYRYDYTYDNQERFSEIKYVPQSSSRKSYVKRFEYFDDHFVVNVSSDVTSTEKGDYDLYYGEKKKLLKSRFHQDNYYVDTNFSLDTTELYIFGKEHLFYNRVEDGDGELFLILRRTVTDVYVQNSDVEFNIYDGDEAYLGQVSFFNDIFVDSDGMEHSELPSYLEELSFTYGVTEYNSISSHIPF
ncbi:hypothetical protein EI427_25080 [Flammeovirga pectinis]|uniref:DUF4221 domain-containing protein n=1 Tax=Flammeovirga pectinis TaxID=2494373 RepID=A0A3S9PBI0_9BACT|nr:hypothetical protein [Flammeovirga pectinis]AZQ65489.1 hypothetical protein EI427_25080 [Flammeovirga pectinis]